MAGFEVAARPDFMDDAFLTTCMIHSKGLPIDTCIEINEVSLYYVVPKGENYMSIIYRVNVNYNIKSDIKSNGSQNGDGISDSVIVKVSHESQQLKLMAKEAKIFVKEADMYMNILPKIIKTLKDAGIDGNIACRCLYSVDGDREMLVMEDLKQRGYILANRLTGVDLSHCKLVYDKLAKMHAASMHYYKTHDVPELYRTSPFENMQTDNFEQMKTIFEDAARKKVAYILAQLKKHPHYGNHIFEFFKRYNMALMDVSMRDMKPVPGNKFNALLHADCWVNNMMFRYNDDGSVQDVLLIDLQISYVSSVAFDFIYFFFSSTNKDVKMNHFKYLQKYYIDMLTHYLKKMGFTGEIPTLEEFDAELRRLFTIIIYMITTFNSIILTEFDSEDKNRSKSEAFEMEDIVNMGVPPRYTEVLLLSIDLLEENGFFDKYDLPELPTNSAD